MADLTNADGDFVTKLKIKCNIKIKELKMIL